MQNLVSIMQRRAHARLAGTASLVLLGLILQGALVFPLLKKTDANLHSLQEAEHLCLQMGRRTRSLQQFHVSRPKFDVTRIQQVIEKLQQLEPKLQLREDQGTRQQLLAALTGTNCSLLEHLWQNYSRQSNSIGVKSRGEFYALFLKASAKSLDSFSDFDYFSKFEQMQIPTRNAHQILGLIALDRKDHLLINRILPFTAAEKEGSIRAGDKIVALEQNNGEIVKFSRTTLPLFKHYLRSQPEVVLRIQRDEGKAEKRLFTVAIKKDEVPTRRAFFYVTSVAGQKIGVVKLPSFYINRFQQAAGGVYEGAAPDVLNALKALQTEQVQVILLDLRGNLGGDKDEALRILGYFLGKKVGIKTRYSDELKSYQTLTERVYKGRMAVLINRLSASASEIVAGAIQDYKRGLILGENSYGKWTVQDVFLFPGFETDEFSGSLRVTVGETMTPLEKRYPITGLKPDVIISHSVQVTNDEQLHQALQVLVKSSNDKISTY